MPSTKAVTRLSSPATQRLRSPRMNSRARPIRRGHTRIDGWPSNGRCPSLKTRKEIELKALTQDQEEMAGFL
jgi:hypothetical protein